MGTEFAAAISTGRHDAHGFGFTNDVFGDFHRIFEKILNQYVHDDRAGPGES